MSDTSEFAKKPKAYPLDWSSVDEELGRLKGFLDDVPTTKEEAVMELIKVKAAWDEFSNKCLSKLQEKVNEGVRGWNDKLFIDGLKRSITGHFLKAMHHGDTDDWIDVANLAMFLWHQGNKEVRGE